MVFRIHSLFCSCWMISYWIFRWSSCRWSPPLDSYFFFCSFRTRTSTTPVSFLRFSRWEICLIWFRNTNLFSQILDDAKRFRGTVTSDFNCSNAACGKFDAICGWVVRMLPKLGMAFMDSNLYLTRGIFLLSDSYTMLREQR